MTKWPAFITRDLDPETEEDGAEMMRRWRAYDRDMKALIAKGGFHLDEDSWWVETATGELVGPDPDLERPMGADEIDEPASRTVAEAFPDFAAAIEKRRGRPPVANPRRQVSIRLDPDVIAHFKAGGKGWQTRINNALRRAAGLDGRGD